MKRNVSRRSVALKRPLTARKRNAPSRTHTKNTLYSVVKSLNGECRVCVIRSVGGIGDVLMTTPALRTLKKEFPKLHLTYAVDRHRTGPSDVYYHMVKDLPYIDEVIDARFVNRANYAHVEDISAVCIRYERSGLPSINRIDLFARALGLQSLSAGKLPDYQPAAQDVKWAWDFLPKGKNLILHTASFEDKRTWSVKNQVAFIRTLEAEYPDVNIILFDFNNLIPSKERYSNIFDASSATVGQKAALIHYADLFVGPDSGMMHLAGALCTKSFVIFGSIPPEARINYYSSHEAIVLNGLPCLGCWYQACSIGVKCMVDLTSEMVLSKVRPELE